MTLSKEEQILAKELFNTDESIVLDTIKILEEKGNEKFIEPLLEVLSSAQSELVKEKTTSLLQEMKNTKAMASFLDLYLEERFRKASAYTLQVVWNANLDASAHLDQLVELALQNDLQTTLEAATVIDSLPGPFEEEQVLDSILQCKTYIDDTSADETRKPLVNDILSVLEDINMHV